MEQYQLVIIGGGVGGLVAASGAAQLGAKVALIDKQPLGGDCLHYGCVPTKSLVQAASVAALVRRADVFGINVKEAAVDFQKVMERRLLVQTHIGKHDDPERFRKMGVEVIFGQGKFIGSHRFEVDGRLIEGKKFIIATGSRPAVPPIPGLAESGFVTNETILGLVELPKRFVVIGAGPIGIEYAQLMRRLGSEVTVLERSCHLLPKDDAELAGQLRQLLTDEGVQLCHCTAVERVERTKSGITVTAKLDNGGQFAVEGDQLLVAVGRTANVEGLGLVEQGVKLERNLIATDLRMRTLVPHIFAVGDVCGPYPFTHIAEYQAGVAISNALFPFIRRHADYRAVPWVTYTDPELAKVGLSEQEARERYGDSIEVLSFAVSGIDRALIEGHSKGMAKVITDRRGKVLGATILAHHAGDLIPEYCLAVRLGLKVQQIAQTIHPYPTNGQLCWRVAQQWYRKKLFDGFVGKASRWFLQRGR